MTADDPGNDAAFESLLESLRDHRGFDFTGYKRSSLRRRVIKRMGEVGVDRFAAYEDYLQVHPEEFAQLFNTILINVTAFFRDPEHWDYLRDDVLPELVERAGDDPVRVWSAGCASGEEAYTIAILLAELVGEGAFADRVKIYATDVDDDALVTARHAAYDADALESVPAELRERYFEPSGSRFVVAPDLRRAVIFGRHDLVSDAPISRLDLLICRNVLMYFNSETQGRILRQLHFGLKTDGYVFLGKAEMLLTRTELFEPVNLGHRVFRKVPVPPEVVGSMRDRTPPAGRYSTAQARVRDAAFAAGPEAQIVIDEDGLLSVANDDAQRLFRLDRHDFGRPLQDLELSYRPVELRSRIEKVRDTREEVRLRRVEHRADDADPRYYDVSLVPLVDDAARFLGVSVTFDDVTEAEELRGQLQRSNQDLETAYEELQSTNEELETTNEELQSTVEELETTNEELQSSNEELETMNEELQSTNAEQEAVNRELMARTAEVDRLNAYLASILASVNVGVVVVDADFGVRMWNDVAHDLWGLRSEEVVGRSVLSLDIGLDVARLAEPARACLAGTEESLELTLTATNRRGRSIECRVLFAPLIGPDGARQGVIMLMESVGDAKEVG